MPLFEYKCESCNETFERLIIGSGRKTVTCPACHGEKVRKLVSSGSFLGAESSSGSGGSVAPCGPTSGG